MAESLHLITDFLNDTVGESLHDAIAASSFAAKFDGYIVNPLGDEGNVKLLWNAALTSGDETELDGIIAAHDGSHNVVECHKEIFKLFEPERVINDGANWVNTPAGMLNPNGLGTQLSGTSIHLIIQYTCFGNDAEGKIIQRVVENGTETDVLVPVTLPNTAPDNVTDVWETKELEGSPGALAASLCDYVAAFRANTSENFKVRNVMCEFTER